MVFYFTLVVLLALDLRAIAADEPGGYWIGGIGVVVAYLAACAMMR